MTKSQQRNNLQNQIHTDRRYGNYQKQNMSTLAYLKKFFRKA